MGFRPQSDSGKNFQRVGNNYAHVRFLDKKTTFLYLK